ncbi:MAG: biotin--[acetyl-CoA-carboxylase] ligase [Candidatus Poseidoniales archaeon]
MIHIVDNVKSTNNWLSDFLSISDSVLAIKQSEGKGRRGNTWSSDSGGLYFSFTSSYKRLLPFIIGISVVESLVNIKDDIKLKWPNDIILNGKKLGGILCENYGDYTVIGIGLNISNNILLSEAINLYDVNYKIDKLEFISFFEVNFTDNFNLSSKKILEKYAKLDFLMGKNIVWNQGSGVVESIDVDGSLIVNSSNKIINLYSEEVHIEKY